jgi:hypothetical protein
VGLLVLLSASEVDEVYFVPPMLQLLLLRLLVARVIKLDTSVAACCSAAN